MGWVGQVMGRFLQGTRPGRGLTRWMRLFCLWLSASLLLAAPVPRQVVVGINRDYPPYEYLDAKGRPAGYDVDLLKAVAEVEGLNLVFRADTWDNTFQAFRQGQVDLLAGLLRSPAREAFADFSSPHLVVHYSLFVRRGDTRIRGLSDLAGRRVLVERQSQMHEYLQSAALGAQMVPVASEPEALRKLAAGEGDAAAAPQLEGLVLEKADGLAIAPVGGPLFTRQLCFALRKDTSPELLARLNTGLAILNQTGRYAEIYQAWFGHLEPDPRAGLILARRTLAVLAVVALALVLVAVWNRVLRRQVGQATARLEAANREIQAREAYLSAVLEQLPVAIFGKDPRHGYAFTLWNARSEEMFGLRKEEVMGRDDFAFFPQDQAEAFRAKDEEVIRTGRIVEIPEERIQSRALGEILLHTRKVPLFDEAGHPFLLLGISENITEQRAMEEAMRQAQKLESLGVLAGGIAHDFNNLLTAILGNLGLAALHAGPDHATLPYLRNAETTALRAADLTRQMLAYSGRAVFIVRPVDLSRLAEEMTSLLKVSLSKKAVLRFEFAPDVPTIQADPAQLQQVVMNLVTNASEALGDRGGEICLATGTVELDAAQAAALHPGSPIPPGRYVLLSVKDEGSGMTPDVLSRIFDPFFTTKFSGRGLGLSAMLGILRAHRAGIAIQTGPGQGTVFRLYFPVGPIPETGPESGESAGAAPRPGTVLLVEDEPEIRESTATLLRSAGFEVIEAADGEAACEAFARERHRIQVVLMDLTMPRKSGDDATREILALDPKARIILTSGFPLRPESASGHPEGLAGFLQKPYQFQDLLNMLQRALPAS